MRKIEGGRRSGQQTMRWWKASPTRLTGVWVRSWSWWWTGRPGVLQSVGSQSWTRLSDELNWTELTGRCSRNPVFSLKFSLSTCWGGNLSSCRTQRHCCIYFFRRNQDPVQRLHYCFLTAPPLFVCWLLTLINNYLNLPFEFEFPRESQWGWMKLICYKPSLLGEDNGTPLQYSCLENPMDGGAWWAAVHGVARSRTRLKWLSSSIIAKSRARLSDFTFTLHFHALEKEMATHCSVLAWRILGTGEPGGLPSMGLHRVRHDWSDLAAAIMLHRGFCAQEGPTWSCWVSLQINTTECW